MDKKLVFEFLDELRESGAVNMFGATPLIVMTFGYDRDTSRKLLADWMNTFSERHPELVKNISTNKGET